MGSTTNACTAFGLILGAWGILAGIGSLADVGAVLCFAAPVLQTLCGATPQDRQDGIEAAAVMGAVASAGHLFGEAAQWRFGIPFAVLGAALCQTLGPVVARLLHRRAVRRATRLEGRRLPLNMF
jgi:hypothetical protein